MMLFRVSEMDSKQIEKVLLFYCFLFYIDVVSKLELSFFGVERLQLAQLLVMFCISLFHVFLLFLDILV